MTLAQVDRHIHDHASETIDLLTRFCRQPSVSADGRGIAEMAKLLEETLSSTGAQVITHTSPGRNPILVARYEGESSRRLVLYNHYDVQPPEPVSAWDSNPFEPVIVNGAFFARGAADNKGALVARIAAVRAIRAVCGRLPIEVVHLIEGEEESGSRFLREFVPQNAELFDAEGIVWEEASADQTGAPVMRLGNKGSLQVELVSSGPNADVHSRFAGIFPNPIWRLVSALASMRGADGTVLIDGFSSSVIAPTDEEEGVYADLSGGIPSLLERHGLTATFPPTSNSQAATTLYHHPTCNITGFSGGYVGQGLKNIVPAEARARLEFRLVPRQTPTEMAKRLRTHLAAHGFNDVEVRELNGMLPSKTPMDHPFSRFVARVGLETYGKPLTIEPSSSGSGPRSIFSSVTDAPIVALGVSHAGSRIHGPNENILLDGLLSHARHIANLIVGLGTHGS